jgi:hypothetical protein
MPCITGCCCFRTLERGSRGSAFFTLVIALCNIAIDITALVKLFRLNHDLIIQESWLYLPPGIIVLTFIELAFSFAQIGLGALLLIGINYGYDGQRMIFIWVYGMIFDRIYDIFLGVYIMSWIGGHRFTDVIYVVPESIVVAVYWLLNSFVLIAAILCVVSYWQELLDDLYGKERRVKYYNKLSNIRTAALSANATPYRSHYGSRSTMASQGALNNAYVTKY